MKKNNQNYCHFYIIRHGETEWNIEGRLQGQKDSSLTANGKRQAKELAKMLRQVKFDECFSSDLTRAADTAQILALDHQLAVKTSALLREGRFGRFEGKTKADLQQELQTALDIREQLSREERFRYRTEETMETDEEMMARMITFLRQTALAYSGKTVLVVSHGAMMRTLLIHLGWAEYGELEGGAIENSGFIVLDSDGVDFFVKETDGVTKSMLSSK